MKDFTLFSKGLTLIELLVAVSVIAILLAIGVPSYNLLFESDRLRGGRPHSTLCLTYPKLNQSNTTLISI